MALSYENPESGEALASSDSKIRTALVKIKEAVVTLEGGTHPVTWYTPKIIATEESRENTAFGTMTTPDEITGIVVPANSYLTVHYRAHVKSTVANVGRMALFVDGNQLKQVNAVIPMEESTVNTQFLMFTTAFVQSGWFGQAETADATTGQMLAGGLDIFCAAGTHTLSAQFKASSGAVVVKERKLFVEVHGV